MTTKTKKSHGGAVILGMTLVVLIGVLQQTLANNDIEKESNILGRQESISSSLTTTEKNLSYWKVSLLDFFIKKADRYGSSDKKDFPIHNSANEKMETESTSTKNNSTLGKQECIPAQVEVTDSPYKSDIERAIANCLVVGYKGAKSSKFHTYNNLTHEAMIAIAQRAGYNVSLQRGGQEVVTKSEFFAFIDYLQDSGQIGLIPSLEFDNIIKRGQYISFIRVIASDKYKTATTEEAKKEPAIKTKNTSSEAQQSNSITKDTTGKDSQISVAEFKKALNTSLKTPLEIQSYDDKIMINDEIIHSLLAENLSTIDKNNDNKVDLGVNKELVKQTLSRLVEKI